MNNAQPVMIIGAARSGTKLLRDVLAAHADVRAIPFDINYVWRHGCVATQDDVLDPATLTDARRDHIRAQVARLSKAQPGQILLEKTVSNTLRVPFVDSVFPDARYVHLLRDGRDVTESAMRQWMAPPNWRALWTKLRSVSLADLGYVFWFAANFLRGRKEGRGGGKIWGPRFPGSAELFSTASLAEVCAVQWVECVTRARADLAALPASSDRVFTIRYEDLVSDPAAIEELAQWLGLGDAASVMAEYHAKVRRPERALWTDLPPEDQATLRRVVDPTLSDLGYLP